MNQKYSTLSKTNLNRASLYACREDMVYTIASSFSATNIAEIGVALGKFSDILISAFNPSLFSAFDIFQLHTGEYVFGQSSKTIFAEKSHFDFYSNKIKTSYPDIFFTAHQGDSSTELFKSEFTYDLIYIDGDHRYEGVLKDTNAALQKISDRGILIFNDYILYDRYHDLEYGVVQVVNNLCNATDWKVIGFALQHGMFCDIALQRN